MKSIFLLEYKLRRLNAHVLRAIALEWGATYPSRSGDAPAGKVNRTQGGTLVG